MTSSIFSDSQWHSAEHATRQWPLTSQLRNWLSDPGSLTQRLQSVGEAFSVRVLQHRVGALSEDEVRIMKCDGGLACQVREVLLCEQLTPWVFARSIIPEATEGLLHELQNIGDNPLGQALFTHSSVSPGDFELALFEPQSQIGRLNTRLTSHSQNIYGRRRIFWVDQAPVLVAEVFLSGAPCYNIVNHS